MSTRRQRFDANRSPLFLLRDRSYLATFDAEDAPEFSVICDAGDSFRSMLERARRYPGWVEIICHRETIRSRGSTTVRAETWQCIPKQFTDIPEFDSITVGQASAMLHSGVKVTGESSNFERQLAAASRLTPA